MMNSRRIAPDMIHIIDATMKLLNQYVPGAARALLSTQFQEPSDVLA